MWKKDTEPSQQQPQAVRSQTLQGPPKTTAANKTAGEPPAVIGSSISIKGDLSGEEDLVVEGRVEGEVRLRQHSVTIGRSGRVKANVFGLSIRVEGEVHGNLTGDEEVVIRNTGRVEGNIVAPRVTLEDGSSFRGAIDMQTPQQTRPQSSPTKPQSSPTKKGHQPSSTSPSEGATKPSKATA